jgi:hypothetical protein
MLLYILLTIIAVGVLLASSAGKKLLGWLVALLAIGAFLYVAFLVIVLVYASLVTPGGQNFMNKTGQLFGIIVVALITIALCIGDYAFLSGIWKHRKEIFGEKGVRAGAKIDHVTPR